MKLEQNIYPYNPDMNAFPFFLTGIGGSRYQYGIDRPDGYHWNQILYCAENSGKLIFDGMTVVINPGDYFFLPKNYPHSYAANQKSWDVRWTAFDGYACDDVLERFTMTKPIVVHSDSETNIERIFDKMLCSQRGDILYCDYTCSGLVYDYIIGFHRLMNSALDNTRSRRLSMLQPALQYMQENYRNDFSLTVLSEMSGITQQHFCRIFKGTMNMRPNEYLIGLRINEAKRLILDTDCRISDIALECGFRDASYFSTVFKRYVGVYPNAFRKKTP